MPSLNQQRTHKFLHARQQHPAWLLLASRRAPLMLSCLDALFEHQRDGVPFDDAVQALADMLAAHASDPFEGPRKIVVAMGEMIERRDLETVTPSTRMQTEGTEA